jgi:hypothetical protein
VLDAFHSMSLFNSYRTVQSAPALLRDLRHAGEANAVAERDRRIPPRALFPLALARCTDPDGRLRMPLRLAMMTGWAPAASQPKPLAPGSATFSLRDALRS